MISSAAKKANVPVAHHTLLLNGATAILDKKSVMSVAAGGQPKVMV